MSDRQFDLLTEPLLEIVLPDDTRTGATLPGVLARLSAGEAIEFAALQPHQSHAWHACLVQLAAIAVHRAGDGSTLPPAEAEWARMLRALTAGDDAPWCLVVDDLGQPAFMQPPVPEGSLDGFKKERYTRPDELDVLITTRNHDVKSARMGNAQPQHWAYVLVTLQTGEGFSGRGNYGIARMNGGFASRPAVAVVHDLDSTSRFKRDVEVWLEARAEILARSYGYQPDDGLAVLWLQPWDGESSLALTDCDPFFIEVCRRIRLQMAQGRLVAHLAPTTAARLEAKELKGDTGDIWTPLRMKDGASLTVGAGGFSYNLMHELVLGDDYQRSPALELREADSGELAILAQVLVRGQGTTHGWHERILPIPPRVRMLFRSDDERVRLGQLSKRRVERADEMRRRVLRPALLTLLQGAPDKLDMQDDRGSPWLAELDAEIDRVFFDQLWSDSELTTDEADAAWDRLLFEKAGEILQRAIGAVPLPSAHRYRVIAMTERVFGGAAYNKRFRSVVDRADPVIAQHREERHEPPATT